MDEVKHGVPVTNKSSSQTFIESFQIEVTDFNYVWLGSIFHFNE